MSDDYVQVARRNMVKCQIQPDGVSDERILSAFSSVNRQTFVPDEFTAIAYSDMAIPLENGRRILVPVVLGKMLQAAEISETDVVLDIGCNLGYTAAILSKIAGKVIALDNVQNNVTIAMNNLYSINAKNTKVVTADLLRGYEDAAPYDVIFVEGMLDTVETELQLFDLLSDDGRLVMPVTRDNMSIREFVLFRKTAGGISKSFLFFGPAESL